MGNPARNLIYFAINSIITLTFCNVSLANEYNFSMKNGLVSIDPTKASISMMLLDNSTSKLAGIIVVSCNPVDSKFSIGISITKSCPFGSSNRNGDQIFVNVPRKIAPSARLQVINKIENVIFIDSVGHYISTDDQDRGLNSFYDVYRLVEIM